MPQLGSDDTPVVADNVRTRVEEINDTDSPYLTQSENEIHADTASADVTITIASADIPASGEPSRSLTIINTSTNNVVIETEGSETIYPDDVASLTISTDNAFVTVKLVAGNVYVDRNVSRNKVESSEVVMDQATLNNDATDPSDVPTYQQLSDEGGSSIDTGSSRPTTASTGDLWVPTGKNLGSIIPANNTLSNQYSPAAFYKDKIVYSDGNAGEIGVVDFQGNLLESATISNYFDYCTVYDKFAYFVNSSKIVKFDIENGSIVYDNTSVISRSPGIDYIKASNNFIVLVYDTYDKGNTDYDVYDASDGSHLLQINYTNNFNVGLPWSSGDTIAPYRRDGVIFKGSNEIITRNVWDNQTDNNYGGWFDSIDVSAGTSNDLYDYESNQYNYFTSSIVGTMSYSPDHNNLYYYEFYDNGRVSYYDFDSGSQTNIYNSGGGDPGVVVYNEKHQLVIAMNAYMGGPIAFDPNNSHNQIWDLENAFGNLNQIRYIKTIDDFLLVRHDNQDTNNEEFVLVDVETGEIIYGPKAQRLDTDFDSTDGTLDVSENYVTGFDSDASRYNLYDTQPRTAGYVYINGSWVRRV